MALSLINPTGTAMLQNQLAIAIRKRYRARLRDVLDRLKSNRNQIEKYILIEAQLRPDAISTILLGLDGIDKDIKPLIFGVLGNSWLKASKDTNDLMGTKNFLGNMNVLDAVRNNAFGFIEKYGAEKRQDLQNILTEGITQGDSISSISNEIRQAFKTTAFRSEVIARSEVIRAYNTGAYESMKQAGAKQYKWITAKEGTDPKSGALDRTLNGKIFTIGLKGKMSVVDDKGKTNIISRNPMPVTSTHPNCKCRISPFIKI